MRRLNISFNLAEKIRISDNKQQKENPPFSGLCCYGGRQYESQRKRKERKVLGPCQRTQKAVEHMINGDTNCNKNTWNAPQRFAKGAARFGN